MPHANLPGWLRSWSRIDCVVEGRTVSGVAIRLEFQLQQPDTDKELDEQLRQRVGELLSEPFLIERWSVERRCG